MLFFVKLLSLFLFVKTNIGANQSDYINIFKKTLFKYNIMYDNLETFKSGAICIPHDIDKVFSKYAIGFSHNIYKKKTANKIALEGCEEMKKKLISYDIEKQKLEQEKASERKSLVGTGDRSEKIRTYNFPQGRITDHRLKLTLYNIDNFIDGDIDEMVSSLKAQSNAEKLLEIENK